MGALMHDAYMVDGTELHFMERSIAVKFGRDLGILGASFAWAPREGGGGTVSVVLYTDDDDEQGVRVQLKRGADGSLRLSAPFLDIVMEEGRDDAPAGN